MIYTCQSKGCHFIFGNIRPSLQCPDCGKRHLRPADRLERTEYLRRQTGLTTQNQQSS